MILMWRHPKYYQELAKKRKQLEREQANERASEQASDQASDVYKRQVYKQTGERGALKQLYTFEGRYLYEYKVTFCTS